MFSQIASTLSVHDQIFSLHQGKLSVADYALSFTLWQQRVVGMKALITAYCQRLNSNIRQQMAIYDDVTGLEIFIQQ